jgi:hypothetical protein
MKKSVWIKSLKCFVDVSEENRSLIESVGLGHEFKNEKIRKGKLKKILSFLTLVSLLEVGVCSPLVYASGSTLSEEEQLAKEEYERMQMEMQFAEEIAEEQEQMLQMEKEQLIRRKRFIYLPFSPIGVWAEFMTGARMLELEGYPMAGSFLKHSLQSNPTDMYFLKDSQESQKIKDSPEFKKKIKGFINSLPEGEISHSESTHLVLKTPKDLLLSLNKVSVTFNAIKINNNWKITAVIRDVYNFEFNSDYDIQGLNSTFVTIANNYATYAQFIGVIKPYNITILVQVTE